MSKFRKFLAVLLAVCMTVSLIPMNVLADEVPTAVETGSESSDADVLPDAEETDEEAAIPEPSEGETPEEEPSSEPEPSEDEEPDDGAALPPEGEESAEAPAETPAEPDGEEEQQNPVALAVAAGAPWGYNRVISEKKYAVSPGVTEKNYIVNDATNSNQNMVYVMEVDLSNPYASVMPSFTNMDPTVPATSIMSKQAAAAEQKYGVNVVGAINCNLSWADEHPVGMLVVNGEVWHQDTSFPGCYLAVDKNGKAELRDGSVPLKDSDWQAVSSLFDWIIKDGVNRYAGEDHAPTSRAPRTAMGIKADGTLVLLEVDGRQQPTSVGMSMNELGEAMLAMGCVDAVNCDGGGSSTFMSEREGSGKLTVKNSPSDGVERPSLSGLLVISSAKPTGEFDHANITPNDEYYTPGSEIQFTATGVDSTGAGVDLPADLSWKLADESAALGTIDAATGLFKANDNAAGVVTVNTLSGGAVVGTASIELVKPDFIGFVNDEISLGFEASTNFGLVVRYQGVDINHKPGDIVWTLSDERLGTFEGDVFTSSDGMTLNGTVTATSAFDANVVGTIKLIVGMLPTAVWDFEDYTDPETGAVIPAEEYYNSILTTTNYGRGGKQSAEIVSIDDNEPVRMGSHSMKLNFDFTECGAVTEGACVGSTTGMEVPGMPTGIGVWVYAPEGVGVTWEGDGTQAGFWLRGYVTDGTGATTAYDFTLEPKTVTGDQQPGIYWEGWKYCEADLTKFTGPFSVQPGMMFRLMYVYNTKMGTNTAGSVYFDNLQFVYGANVDDVDNPVVNSVTVANKELDNGTVFTTNTVSFKADLYDVQNKYTSGIDTDTVRMYIDGVNTYGDDNYNFKVDPDGSACYLSNVKLLNGDHSITVSLRDKFGNETQETRYFTIKGEAEAGVPTVKVEPKGLSAILGENVDLEIRASDASLVTSNTTEFKLGNQFPEYTVSFSEDYDGTYSFNKNIGVLTVSANRKEGAAGADNVIATVSVPVPTSTKEGTEFSYIVKSGKYTTTAGKTLTYSAAEAKLPVSAPYKVSADTVLTGVPATIRVTNSEGAAASGVGVFMEDGTQIGTTDEKGELVTEAFSVAAGKYVVYAQDENGKLSFHYTVESFDANGENAVPFGIKHNASADGIGQESISWMTNPVQAGKQLLKYAESGSENWTTVEAESEICTFTKEGHTAVAVHNAAMNVKSGTTYRYRVGSGEVWSEEKTFTTGSYDNSTNFFVLGDIQAEDLTNIQAILGNVKTGYDFGLQTGDGVDDATSYANWTDLVALFGTESIGDTDMLHVLGNHEFAGDENADRAEAIYGLPSNGMGSCYSVTYDNVYVAVINYTGTKAQLQSALEWMKQDAAKSDAQWKILSMHQPAYYTNITGGNAEIQALVPAAAEAAGIDMVFSGHDHSYARTEPLTAGNVDKENGTTYFICGSSGEKSYAVENNPDFHFVKATQDYSAIYLDVRATNDDITVTTYNVQPDGSKEVFDTYTKSVPRCPNDDHTYTYDRKTDRLICSECGYITTAAEDLFSGWVDDAETGRKMYFVAGKYQTGHHLISSVHYYLDGNGLAYDGEYTFGGEKCTFKDGVYQSCANANVLLAGPCGAKAEFVMYKDGRFVISGSGDMEDYPTSGLLPWYVNRRSIKSVEIGADITSIGVYTFRGAGTCTSVKFAENSKLKTIDAGAFHYMSSLKEIRLPDSVTSIGSSSFGYCTSLERVYLPEGLSNIADTAFTNCDTSKLVLSVAKDSIAKDYAVRKGIRYEEREATGKPLYSGTCGANATWELYASGTLKILGSGAMTDYSASYSDVPWYEYRHSVRAIEISPEITSIGVNAFRGAINCTKVDFGGNSKVTTIGTGAFYYLSSLKEITLPKSITTIGKIVFAYCKALKTVNFTGDAPKSIASTAFSGLTLTATYPADNATWTESVMQNYGGTITWKAVAPTIPDGLNKIDGVWGYYKDGKVDTAFTGLTKDFGTWFYVEKGYINWDYTGLVKDFGTWFYVEKGVINWNYVGLHKQFGTWFYIDHGILDWKFTGLHKEFGTWFYIENSVLAWNYTGLIKDFDTWFYVDKNVLDWKFTGMTEYAGTWFYVKRNLVDWTYNGVITYNGKTYTVKNGVGTIKK